MDGTMLNANSQLSDETIKTLIQVQQQGIKVVLASGRNPNSLGPYANQLKLAQYGGWLVGVNGQQIVNLTTNKLENLGVIANDIVQEAIGVAQRLDLEFLAVLDDTLYVYMSDALLAQKKQYIQQHHLPEGYYTGGVFDFVNPQHNYPNVFYVKTPDAVTTTCNKIVFTAEPEVMQQHSAQIQAQFKNRIDFAHTSPRWLEGMPSGINKGAAIKKIASSENLDLQDIMVFGDGENDIPMLQVAGVPVAMENAMETVKKHAQIIAPKNTEDGLAVIVKQLIK